MILKMYSVYDRAAEAFTQPFFAQTDGWAIRQFTDTVNDTNSMLHKHAEDYTLYQLGVFNDASGLVEVPEEPKRLISAKEVRVNTQEIE